jgi:hypothetical protein
MIDFEHSPSVILPIGTTEDFPSPSLNDDPMLYPGVKPEGSFLLDGNNVYEVRTDLVDGELTMTVVSPDGRTEPLDILLKKKGAPGLDDRIPVVGYGTNMCPSSLKTKLNKAHMSSREVVPTIYGTLKGYDVVWSGGPGINGNFIADLYKGPETEDTLPTVGINLLTQEQLLVMHSTELAYDLAMVDVNVEGATIKAFVYTGVDNILIRDGRPVAVEAVVAEGRSIDTATTHELLDDILNDPEIYDELQSRELISDVIDADDYVRQTRQLTGLPGARLARKRGVHQVLEDQGKSLTYRLPFSSESLQSWANPSTLPTYGQQRAGVHHNDVYVLPNQVLDKNTWADSVSRDTILRSMGTHFMRISKLEQAKAHIEQQESR